MIKLKKRLFTLFLATIVFTIFVNTAFFTNNAFGDKLTDKLKKAKKQLAKNKATYQGILDKIDSIEANIEQLDSQIEDIMSKIDATNIKIAAAKQEIRAAEKAIDNTSKDIDKEQALYNERLSAMYTNGPTGYLELILNSKSFIDFLERYELAKSIMKFDTNLIQNLQNKKNLKVQQRAQLLQKKNRLISLQNLNKATLAQLNATKNKQNSLISYLKAEEKKYAAAIAEQNALINQTLKQIAEMKKHTKGNTGKYSNDALVVYAANFLGVRYVWGGTTPSGFDCSGFTKYVFSHFGINLNRVSRDQATQGATVSRANLQPGDLVFFGRPIHHVGIYVGNNCFIHAPRTGDVVRISPLTRSDFVLAKRVK